MNTATNYAALYLAAISKNQVELEKEVKNNPASSVVRFLWLCQLKKNNDPRFNEVARHTGIYLQNPYWLDFQLSDLQINGKDLEDNLIISPETIDLEEKRLLTVEENNLNEEMPQPVNEEITENPVFENENFIEENINEEPSISEENKKEEIIEKQVSEVPQPVNEQITENPVSGNENLIDQNIGEDINEQQSISEENKTEEIVKKQDDIELPAPVNEQITENPVLEYEDFTDQNIEGNINEQQSISEENKTEEIGEKRDDELSRPVNEQIIENPVGQNENLTDQNIEEDKKPESTVQGDNVENENENEIPFEPLHTVDYFASQGIKLNEDALNNDQLGKQVKSFTAWIKSMKKLHPGQLPEQNEVIEKLIQTSSEVSNQSANVLTEAMAEVLIKQNKREKAIEMYQKLSLINPSKSAYFAAKIESLKFI